MNQKLADEDQENVRELRQENMHQSFFKSENELFECLVNLYWKVGHKPFEKLEKAIKTAALPRIGEILWDEFKDKSIWHLDDCQVMNIIFMNIDEVREIYEEVKRRADANFGGDVTKAFRQILL